MALVLMAAHLQEDLCKDGKAGGVHDPLGEENLNRLLQWLLGWKRTGVDVCLPRKRVWIMLETLWLGECDDTSDGEEAGPLGPVKEEHRRAGGGSRSTRKSRTSVDEAIGESIVTEDTAVLPPFDGRVGTLVEDWIDENLSGYLADSTAKQYAGVNGKWRAWAKRQGWPTEYLRKAERTEENEEKLLGFLGYLGWLGVSMATIKQAVFAIKDGHKRHGHDDRAEKMYRLWMLVGALDRRSPKKPRRLGVTPDMLKWIGKELTGDAEWSAVAFDGAML